MPSDLAILPNGDVVVSDTANNCLRVVAAGTGSVATLAGNTEPGCADGAGREARFNYQVGVSVLPSGDLVVADTGNHLLRLVNTKTGDVSTLAGSGQPGSLDGPATEASFVHPVGVTVLQDGDIVVADTGNHKLRLVKAQSWEVSTLAGTGARGYTDGPTTEATFNGPNSVAVLLSGDVVVADEFNHCVRKVHLGSAIVSTLAGTGQKGDADGAEASFKGPSGVGVMTSGDVLVADTGNNRLRAITC